MRALVRNVDKERMQKERKLKKKKEKEEKERLKPPRIKEIEWNRLREKYPDIVRGSLLKQIFFRNIHPNLKARINAKCKQDGITLGAKIRSLMLDCMEDKIDHLAVSLYLQGKNIEKDFGPIPKGGQPFVVKFIPEPLILDFKKWCDMNGCTITGKIKQLLYAYWKGII